MPPTKQPTVAFVLAGGASLGAVQAGMLRALYERGVQLSRFCHARLEEAEHRIEILNERGELKPAPASLTSDDASTSLGIGPSKSKADPGR